MPKYKWKIEQLLDLWRKLKNFSYEYKKIYTNDIENTQVARIELKLNRFHSIIANGSDALILPWSFDSLYLNGGINLL